MERIDRHHVIPKHEWKQRFGSLEGVNSPDNLVTLTLKQHIEAHKWLWEQYQRTADYCAWKMLAKHINKPELIHIFAVLGGKSNKGRKLGPQSLERRKKTSDVLSGVKKSLEHIQAQSESRARNWILISPLGESTLVHNLSAFCRKNNLRMGNLCKVASGIRKHHKGWTCQRAAHEIAHNL